jgi:hypothetical protein
MAAAQRNLDSLRTLMYEAYESTEIETNQKG